MRLYHGTSKVRLRSILKHGLIADGVTKRKHGGAKYVRKVKKLYVWFEEDFTAAQL
jgi:hypothetical protein